MLNKPVALFRTALTGFGLAAILVYSGLTPIKTMAAVAWSCGSRSMPSFKIPVRAAKPKRMALYLEGVWDGRTRDGRSIRLIFETDEKRPIPDPKRFAWLDKKANRMRVGTWRGSDSGASVTFTHKCGAKGRNCLPLASPTKDEMNVHPAEHYYFCWKGAKFKRVG